MSHQSNGVDIPLVAAADLRTKQFHAIKVDTSGLAALAGAGEFAIGVLQNKPNTGETAVVRIGGLTKFVSGGSITAGDLIASDANGKAKTAAKATVNTSDAGAASDAVVGSNVMGVAAMGASASDVFTVILAHSGASPTTAS